MVRKTDFIKTDINALDRSLEQLIASLSESGSTNTAYSARNMIVLTSLSEFEELDKNLLSDLIKINPARFFILVVNKDLMEPECRLSVACRIVSKEDHICSEIIKIEFSSGNELNLASILRSHLLSGVPTDFLIADGQLLSHSILENLVSLSDCVIYQGHDSSDLKSVYRAKQFCNAGIDLEWIGLAQWREVVRMLFELPLCASKLQNLSRITIVNGSGVGTKQLSALYTAGWILFCLKVEVTAYGMESYECRFGDGHTLELVFSEKGEGSGLNQIIFDFKEQDQKDETALSVNISVSGDSILTQASGVSDFRIAYPLKEYNKVDLLRRFFLVGTSLKQYDNALKLAIDLESLRQGYRFS